MAKPEAASKEPATRGRKATPGPGLGGPGIGDVGDAAKAAAKTGGATPPGVNVTGSRFTPLMKFDRNCSGGPASSRSGILV